MAYKRPCDHKRSTPVPVLCAECRRKRARVRDRLNRREARARKKGLERPPPLVGARLTAETTIDLAETLDAANDILRELNEPGRPLSLEEQQLSYAISQIQRLVEPAIRMVIEEVVEIQRPTTDNPDYTPKRTRAIGPERWRRTLPRNATEPLPPIPGQTAD